MDHRRQAAGHCFRGHQILEGGLLKALCACTGSFTSAAGPNSETGRPSDKDEMFSDAVARDDSFASAASFGQASAVSAKSFQSAKSGNRVS